MNKASITKSVKQYLKKYNYDTKIVKVKMMGDTIVIDNLHSDNAATIATFATGLDFRHMTQSMAQLVS